MKPKHLLLVIILVALTSCSQKHKYESDTVTVQEETAVTKPASKAQFYREEIQVNGSTVFRYTDRQRGVTCYRTSRSGYEPHEYPLSCVDRGD
ncbi:hypothetical protein LUCX_227 [Xanthomonas phage vB_XciM_LucasX]|nr:hypothetical protein LUCX_227 [Xanthomonas phage vB_XciM_LucasX]